MGNRERTANTSGEAIAAAIAMAESNIADCQLVTSTIRLLPGDRYLEERDHLQSEHQGAVSAHSPGCVLLAGTT